MNDLNSSKTPNTLPGALPRGLALFLGGFALLNLLSRFRSSRADENLWWIDLRWLPPAVGAAVLLCASICLLAFALRPPRSVVGRALTIVFVASLAMACLFNAAQFYVLMARGAIVPGLPVPLSLFVSAALVFILFAAVRNIQVGKDAFTRVPGMFSERSGKPRNASLPVLSATILTVFISCIIVFSLAQMFCFGKTDYRRPADVAVVLGARVYADGRLSDALADRMRTACQLYRDGVVKKLLVSGGPGEGPIHETEAMRQMAVRLGVKNQDILVDRGGLNTQATVRNSQAILAQLHASRVLVVSHFYHLPRIKMTYQRAGREVYTVPARESYFLWKMPIFLAREVAAFWVYYARGLAG